jgi:hypothetical protein
MEEIALKVSVDFVLDLFPLYTHLVYYVLKEAGHLRHAK